MDLIVNCNGHSDCISTIARPPVLPFFHNIVQRIYESPSAPIIDLLVKHLNMKGRWIALTPIHCETTHNDSTITAYGDEIGLSNKQSQSLFQRCKSFVEQEGLCMQYYHRSLWLLQVNQQPALHNIPPHIACGQSLMPIIERWGDDLYWQRLFTELQMLLAQQAQLKGLSFNALWPWGDDRLTSGGKTLLSNDENLIHCLEPYLQINSLDTSLKAEMVVLNPVEEDAFAHFKSKATNIIYNNGDFVVKNSSLLARLWRKFC